MKQTKKQKHVFFCEKILAEYCAAKNTEDGIPDVLGRRVNNSSLHRMRMKVSGGMF